LAGRAAIAAGLGAGASKFTKLGKPDVYGMPGYIGYQTAEDWGPSVLGKETYEGAKKAGKAALEKGTNYIKSKFGYADGGEVEDALRLARSRQGYATDGGVPDEGGQKEFLKESLKDSAPQYDPEGGMKTAKEAGQLVAGMTTPGAIADAAGYLGGPSATNRSSRRNYVSKDTGKHGARKNHQRCRACKVNSSRALWGDNTCLQRHKREYASISRKIK
jgi:hypothetical protein